MHGLSLFALAHLVDAVSIWQEFKDYSREQFDAEYSTPISLIHGNGGAVLQAIAQDSWMGEELIRRGLTRVHDARDRTNRASVENVYGCILNYLVRPIPTTQHAVAQYAAILAHPQVFSIAMQIRTGDEAFQAGNDAAVGTVKALRPWFECAAQVR